MTGAYGQRYSWKPYYAITDSESAEAMKVTFMDEICAI